MSDETEKRSQLSVSNMDANAFLLSDIGLLALARILEFANDPLTTLEARFWSKTFCRRLSKRHYTPPHSMLMRIAQLEPLSSVHAVRCGNYHAVKRACRRGELRTLRWLLCCLRRHVLREEGPTIPIYECDLFAEEALAAACVHGHVDAAQMLWDGCTPSAFQKLCQLQRVDITRVRLTVFYGPYNASVGSWMDATLAWFFSAYNFSTPNANAACTRLFRAIRRGGASVQLFTDKDAQQLQACEVKCGLDQCAKRGRIDVARVLLSSRQVSLDEHCVLALLCMAVSKSQLTFARWFVHETGQQAIFSNAVQANALLQHCVSKGDPDRLQEAFDFLATCIGDVTQLLTAAQIVELLTKAALQCSEDVLQHMMRSLQVQFGNPAVAPGWMDEIARGSQISTTLADVLFLAACIGFNAPLAKWLYQHNIVRSMWMHQLCLAGTMPNKCLLRAVFHSDWMMLPVRLTDDWREHLSEKRLRLLEFVRATLFVRERNVLFYISPAAFGRIHVRSLCGDCPFSSARIVAWMRANMDWTLDHLEHADAIKDAYETNNVPLLQFLHARFGLRQRHVAPMVRVALKCGSLNACRWAYSVFKQRARPTRGTFIMRRRPSSADDCAFLSLCLNVRFEE